MPEYLPAIIAGISLICIELIRSIPALLRVKNTVNSDGVSGTSLGVLAGTGLSWIFLAFLIQSWWVLAANIIWLGIHLALCREVSAISSGKKKQILITSAISAGVLILASIAGYAAGGLIPTLNVVVSLTAVFYGVPALYEGLTSTTTRGLSVIALSVNSIEGFIYLLSGLGILVLASNDDTIAGFIFFGVISIVANGLRLVRVIYRRIKGLDEPSLPVMSNA